MLDTRNNNKSPSQPSNGQILLGHVHGYFSGPGTLDLELKSLHKAEDTTPDIKIREVELEIWKLKSLRNLIIEKLKSLLLSMLKEINNTNGLLQFICLLITLEAEGIKHIYNGAFKTKISDSIWEKPELSYYKSLYETKNDSSFIKFIETGRYTPIEVAFWDEIRDEVKKSSAYVRYCTQVLYGNNSMAMAASRSGFFAPSKPPQPPEKEQEMRQREHDEKWGLIPRPQSNMKLG